MDKDNNIRLAITGAFGLFCAYFQWLVVPLGIMTLLMIVDYVTGMTKAWVTNQVSSKVGVVGIIKKVGYFCIVLCAMVLDYLIKTTLLSAGIVLPENFTIAILVILWLIVNEIISILENLAIMGVNMPRWLISLVKKLKVVAEKNGENLTNEERK